MAGWALVCPLTAPPMRVPKPKQYIANKVASLVLAFAMLVFLVVRFQVVGFFKARLTAAALRQRKRDSTSAA
jgi:hypothetical protein